MLRTAPHPRRRRLLVLLAEFLAGVNAGNAVVHGRRPAASSRARRPGAPPGQM